MLLHYFEILIPLFGITLPAIICWIIFNFLSKGESRKHETLRELIKSGQQISPEIIKGLSGHNDQTKSDDIRKGAILIGVGSGLIFFGYIGIDTVEVAGVGGFLAALGLALLSYGLVNKKTTVKPKT